MSLASRAVMSSAQPAGMPMRVLPFNSPLRSVPGIDRVSRTRIYPKGTVVFREGNAALGVYVLSSGRAKISIASADGKKLILRIARSGDILGLCAGLTGRPFEATAEMVEGGRVDFISRRDLLNLIGRQNGSGLDLLEVFSRQFSELVEHTRIIALSESALEKLARLIMRWSRDFGERTADGIRLKLLLTQEEIAQIIGASRETVTRLFSALKRDQIIHVKRDVMWIRDSAALASLAQLSPDAYGCR
jgi:CRP/FNR family transcriptional regulator, cyclic AMP receptor protein